MKRFNLALVFFLFLLFFPVPFVSASPKPTGEDKKSAENCRLNPRGCGMPEQAPGDFDTYWWNGDTYMKWDLETGATSQVHGSDWKQQGKYFHHGTETNKVEEVKVSDYYANTGQEGYWTENGKVYRYNPGKKKVEEVSSTLYWKDESGAVYTYDKSAEEPRQLSEDGYWAEGGKYYKLGENGEKVEVSALEFITGGTEVTPAIRKLIKLELDEQVFKRTGKAVYHPAGYKDITCSENSCYLGNDTSNVVGTYGSFISTSVTGTMGGSAEFTFGGNIKDPSVTENKFVKDISKEAAEKKASANGDNVNKFGDKLGKGTEAGNSAENNNDNSNAVTVETDNDNKNTSFENAYKNGDDSKSSLLDSHPKAGWHCEGTWAVLINASGTETKRKECSYRCVNGECIEKPCTPLNCSYYYARRQCGSGLDNGCKGTLNCSSCPAGLQCVSGVCRCVPKTKCSEKSECGFENDGCGGRVSCGSCREGFQCNTYWHECVPEEEKQELEVQNVNAFVYSKYAIISWGTSRRAGSVLEAGLTPELGSFKKVSNSAVNHSVFLSGLEPGKTYYYKIKATAGAQAVESKVFSFTTKAFREDSGLKVLFIAVDPPGKAQYEGYSFSFTAVTNAVDQSKLEFDWDFGDGTRAENAGYIFFHTYYGLMKKEKDFNVRVVVRDEKGRTASASVKVTVIKAVFKPMLLKPKPFETVSKENDLNIAVGFVDENNAVIPCNDVNLRVLLENNPVEMKCLTGNYFAGSTHPGLGVNDMQLLRIAAEYKKNGKQYIARTRAPVYFAPLKVRATSAFEKKEYHLNDVVESARVRFLIDNMFIATPEKIEASLVSTKQEKKVKIERSGYDYLVRLNHRVEEADLENGLALRLSGKDSHGNVIAEFQSVPIEGNNPHLTITALQPTELEKYSFGARIAVRAKLFSSGILRDKKLYLECKEAGIESEMTFDAFKKEYFTFINLPGTSFPHNKLTLKLYATAVAGKTLVESISFIHINLSRNLKPVFVFPSADTGILGDSISNIDIRLLQPNGKIFNARRLEAILLIDNNLTENLALNFDDARNLYHAVLTKPVFQGTHLLKLTLGSGYHGSAAITANIKKENFLQGILMFGVLGLALILLVLFLSRLARGFASERKSLINQKKRLVSLKKKYKYEYYKRHIGEKEFRKSTKKIDGALALINVFLRKKHWLYTGFFKAIFPRDIKKCPEFFQVDSLVVKLVGRRGEFSKAEIVRVMSEEMYSERVIERVLERLYG